MTSTILPRERRIAVFHFRNLFNSWSFLWSSVIFSDYQFSPTTVVRSTGASLFSLRPQRQQSARHDSSRQCICVPIARFRTVVNAKLIFLKSLYLSGNLPLRILISEQPFQNIIISPQQELSSMEVFTEVRDRLDYTSRQVYFGKDLAEVAYNLFVFILQLRQDVCHANVAGVCFEGEKSITKRRA